MWLLVVTSKSTTAIAENFISIFDMDATAIRIPNTFWSFKAVDNAGSDQMFFYPMAKWDI